MKSFVAMACVVVLPYLTACGTVPSKMENVSPEPSIPEVSGFTTIPSTAYVRPEKPGDMISQDVANSLTQGGVFAKVSLADPGKSVPHFELVVKHTAKSDLHFGEGMGKAFLSGLTFGMASSSQVDPYDCEVVLDASILLAGKMIATYQTIGRYHSETSRSVPLAEKQARVKTAVENSFRHALELLNAKIKKDRDLYVLKTR